MSNHEHYSMVIEWSEADQAYLVVLPEWSDRVVGGPAVTHGDTYEAAVKHGQQALEALVASAIKSGEALPPARVHTVTA